MTDEEAERIKLECAQWRQTANEALSIAKEAQRANDTLIKVLKKLEDVVVVFGTAVDEEFRLKQGSLPLNIQERIKELNERWK